MSINQFFPIPGQPDNTALIQSLAALSVVSFNRRDLITPLVNGVGAFTEYVYHYDPESAHPVYWVIGQPGRLFIYVGGTNQPISGNIANCYGAVVTLPLALPGVFTNSWWISLMLEIEAEIRIQLPAGWQSMQLNFVGHSHGSAISYLMGLYWSFTYGPTTWNWFGFASPRIFSGAPLPSGHLPAGAAVIVNRGDAVPLVPPPGAIGSISGAGVSQLFQFGNQPRWYHPADRWTYTPSGQRTRTVLVSNDPPLSPDALAAIGTYHPLQRYNGTLASYWRIAGA